MGSRSSFTLKNPIGFLLILGFLLRLVATFVIPHPESDLTYTTLGDQLRYNDIGWNVASGRGFSKTVEGKAVPTAFVPGPLYPLFLASVYTVVGHDPSVVRFVQCIFGILLIWIVYALGQLLLGRTIGLLAAGLTTGYPGFIRLSRFEGPAFLMTENLFIPLFVLSILALVQVTRSPTVPKQVVAGICLGLAALTRSTMLTFPVAFLIWLVCLRRMTWFSILRITATVTFVMLLIVAPWTWRNYRVFHQIVPVSTMGGNTFWAGNNSFARGGWFWSAAHLPPQLKSVMEDEVTYDRLAYRFGLEELKRDLRRIPLLMIKKALVMWMFFTNTHTWQVDWAYLFIGPWALVGWWSTRRNPALWLPVIIPSAYMTGIAMIFFGEPRYRAPLEPLLLLLASVGLSVAGRAISFILNELRN